jgi:hypothetical protein
VARAGVLSNRFAVVWRALVRVAFTPVWQAGIVRGLGKRTGDKMAGVTGFRLSHIATSLADDLEVVGFGANHWLEGNGTVESCEAAPVPGRQG